VSLFANVAFLLAGLGLCAYLAHMRAILVRNRRASADLAERLQGQVRLP
jgi:hypothetical protein